MTQRVIPEELGDWYHRIDLGDGVITPGHRNQSLVFALYESLLPEDLSGMEVLDLGANAGGMSVEFAARGAHVLAIEHNETYVRQGNYVIDAMGLSDRVEYRLANLYQCFDLSRQFDVVCYLGLSYHVRYPQLALDMISHLSRGLLLASSQTTEGDGLHLENRGSRFEPREFGLLYGWEPTEELFIEMIRYAGFQNPRLVSTAPHPGESPGNRCGNRSYFIADRAEAATPLPFLTPRESSSTRPE